MARVSSILIYPERDQPGQTLGTSFVSAEGLDGDRRKIGTTELDVTQQAGDCPGVYAEVPVPGDVSVGDEVLVGVQPE